MPIAVDTSIYPGAQPQVAYAANGDAVVTWDGGAGLSVSTRVGGGDWATPVVLTGAKPYGIGAPHASIDSHGNATVVWFDQSTCNCIRAASHPSGGDWSVAYLTSRAGAPEHPDVAMYGDGSAIAVWDSWTSNVEYAVLNAGGKWSKPHHLMKGYVPRVAANARGDLVISALTDGTTSRRIEATYRPAGGTWGKVTLLSPVRELVARPVVAINKRGLGAVTWEGSRDGLGPAFVSVATVTGGTWSDESILSSRDNEATSLPTVAVDDLGRAFVAWGKRIGEDRRIQAAVMSRAGSWGRVSTISPAGVVGDLARGRRSRARPAVITGNRWTGPRTRCRAVSGRDASGSARAQVSAGGTRDDLEPSLAMDGAGHLTAAWVGYPRTARPTARLRRLNMTAVSNAEE